MKQLRRCSVWAKVLTKTAPQKMRGSLVWLPLLDPDDECLGLWVNNEKSLLFAGFPKLPMSRLGRDDPHLECK